MVGGGGGGGVFGFNDTATTEIYTLSLHDALPIFYSFNVIRIGVLMVVGKHWPEYFDFMHLYFWQATLILMITSVWLLWITQVVNRDWSRSTADS